MKISFAQDDEYHWHVFVDKENGYELKPMSKKDPSLKFGHTDLKNLFLSTYSLNAEFSYSYELADEPHKVGKDQYFKIVVPVEES